jgi:hypothetical protein
MNTNKQIPLPLPGKLKLVPEGIQKNEFSRLLVSQSHNAFLSGCTIGGFSRRAQLRK